MSFTKVIKIIVADYNLAKTKTLYYSVTRNI